MYFLNQANEFYNVYFGETAAESFKPLVIFLSLVSFPKIAVAVRYTFREIQFYTFPLKNQIQSLILCHELKWKSYECGCLYMWF